MLSLLTFASDFKYRSMGLKLLIGQMGMFYKKAGIVVLFVRIVQKNPQ